MEKPSLEIGKGNWAIKENNLLGHTTVDGMILPDPVTVTRATLATRINPSGLVEDVALLGDEILDGGFDIDDNWTKQTGWSIANGVANSVASGSGQDLIRSVSGEITSGKTYKIEYTISNHVTGGVKTFLSGGGAVQGTTNNGNGTYVDYLLAPANNTSFKFTTASGGFTGSIENVSLKEATINGLAKIDYTDGAANLLVEPARTNTAVNSEKAVLYSYNDSVNVSDVSMVTPRGYVSNVVKIEAVAGDNSPIRAASFNLGSYSQNDIVTTSAYVKYNGYRYVQFGGYFSNESARFDLINGVVIQNLSNVISSSIKKAENGWYKLVTTYTFQDNIGNGNLYAGFVLSPETDFSFTNASADGLYAWGFQAELGNYATSYIKTSGTAVTRAKDVIAKTGISDKINSAEGVFFVDLAFLNDTGFYKSVSLSDGTTANRITFENRPVANQVKALIVNGSQTIMSLVHTLTDVKAFNKMAIKWEQDNFTWWINGVKVHTDTSGNIFSANTLNRLAFDRGDTHVQVEGKVRQAQVYKTALTDSELKKLTT